MLQHPLRQISGFALVASLLACGGPSEYVVTGTPRAAGADGLITVEEIEGNRLVTVEIEHLPPPERISEGASVYIVWIKPERGQPTMAGRLEFDPEDRVGRMRATTPHNHFTVLVTAEADPAADSPSDVVVARQEVQ